ncbi:MAG: hypothetical protein JXQ76_01225 [Campylobacterales bacterium]|nr:hypothetical protein [Campylobacterales bacterium]
MASVYIPKIIHQSYSCRYDDLPQDIKNNIKKIKQINPSWEHRYYSDNDIVDFISQYYGVDMLKIYNRINPSYGAARADFFRYLLIYKIGGVWLDIKSTTNSSLDEKLYREDTFILSQWQNKLGERFQGFGLWKPLMHIPGGELQQWHIISATNNPLIKKVIQNVIGNINIYSPQKHGVGHVATFQITGPIAYTLSIVPLLKEYSYRIVDIHRDLDIEYSIYQDRTGHRKLYKQHYSQLQEPLILK